jgi:hypothetical protein
MAPPEIDMRPGGVQQAGGDLSDGAQAAKSTVGTLFDSSDEACSGHSGWSSAGALKACSGAWEKRMTQLITDTEKTASALKKSAASSAAMDAEARQRLTAVLTELKA